MKKILVLSLLVLLPLSVNAGSPTASVTASRTSGKAPLLVFFDATATTDPDTSKPIHHLTYCFESGDGNAEVYRLVADDDLNDQYTKTTQKSSFCGAPLWAYVYETPGTHSMTLNVIDEQGNTDTATINITVSAYASSETTCISSSGNFNGCPTGAAQHISSDFDASIETECLSNNSDTRCLFRAGETFVASQTVNTSESQTGVQIGSYGNAGVSDGKFVVNGTPGPLFKMEGDDGRLTDGSWTGSTSSFFLELDKFTPDTDNFLVQNWKVTTTKGLLDHTHGGATDNILATNVGFFSVEAHDCSHPVCIFTEIDGHAIVDSIIDGGLTTAESHTVRISHGEELWIHASKFLNSADDRTILTLRAFDWTGEPSGNVNRWSKNVFISDSWFAGNSGLPVQICAWGNPTEARCRDYIFERNYAHDTGTGLPVGKCFTFGASSAGPLVMENFTMRNNICDGTNFTQNPRAMFFDMNKTVSDISGLEVYNNTFYVDGASTSVSRFMAAFDPCDLAVNNVAWDNDSGTSFDDFVPCTTQSNNADTDGGELGVKNLTVCPFVVCPPLTLDDFKLITSDPDNLVDGGISVPNGVDFKQNLRPYSIAHDIGALEFVINFESGKNPRVTSVTTP